MPLPVSPVSQPMASEEESVTKWDKYLERLADPGMVNSLMAFGLTALSDRNPGESDRGHLARAAATGIKSFQEGRELQRETERKQEKLNQTGRQVGVQEGQLDVNEGLASETVRHNQAMEKLRADQIASMDNYYKGLVSSAKNSGRLGADDAFTHAFNASDTRIKAYTEVLKNLMPSDPQYQTTYQALSREMENMNRMLQSNASMFSSGAVPPPPPAIPNTREEALAAIQANPLYQKDPQWTAGAEAWLNQQYPAAAPDTTAGSAGATLAGDTPPAAPTEIPKAETTQEIRDKFDRNLGAWTKRTLPPDEARRAIQWLQGAMSDLTPDQRKQADAAIQNLRGK